MQAGSETPEAITALSFSCDFGNFFSYCPLYISLTCIFRGICYIDVTIFTKNLQKIELFTNRTAGKQNPLMINILTRQKQSQTWIYNVAYNTWTYLIGEKIFIVLNLN